MIFVVIHMFLCSILHVFFSEDLFYVRKGKFLKFVHNTLMNSFATIYFHNYLRMDEMPSVGRYKYLYSSHHSWKLQSNRVEKWKSN